jgi:hypothetical protein
MRFARTPHTGTAPESRTPAPSKFIARSCSANTDNASESPTGRRRCWVSRAGNDRSRSDHVPRARTAHEGLISFAGDRDEFFDREIFDIATHDLHTSTRNAATLNAFRPWAATINAGRAAARGPAWYERADTSRTGRRRLQINFVGAGRAPIGLRRVVRPARCQTSRHPAHHLIGEAARPTPTSIRPPENWSSAMMVRAIWTVLRHDRFATNGPRRICVVLWTEAPRVAHPSTTGESGATRQRNDPPRRARRSPTAR